MNSDKVRGRDSAHEQVNKLGSAKGAFTGEPSTCVCARLLVRNLLSALIVGRSFYDE